MFKRIELRNFRVFDHLTFDLTGPNDRPMGCAVVSGGNASGKTALTGSMELLRESALTFARAAGPAAYGGRDDLKELAAECVTIGCDTPMKVSYTFVIKGKDVFYDLRFDRDGSLLEETLKYRSSNGRTITYYTVERSHDGPRVRLNDNLMPRSELRTWLMDTSRVNWGRHTLLSMALHGVRSRDRAGMSSSFPGLVRLSDYMASLNSVMSLNSGAAGRWVEEHPFEGSILKEDEGVLDEYSGRLAAFASKWDPGIAGVEYAKSESDGTISYELFFSRKVAGKTACVPWHMESEGTLALVRMFPGLASCAEGGVAVLDGIDSLGSRKAASLLETVGSGGQAIVASRGIRPPEGAGLFIIKTDADGRRSIAPAEVKAAASRAVSADLKTASGVKKPQSVS